MSALGSLQLEAAHESERRSIARRDVRAERLDPRRARVSGEPVDQQVADAAVLPVVGDRERHLADPAVAHEPCDPDRLAFDVGEQDVMVRIDPGEELQIGRKEHVLRAAEAEPARDRAEPVEDRLDRVAVTAPERPDRDAVDAFGLHSGHAADGPWPAASARRAIFARWPVRATTLRVMEQEIRYLDFEGRRLAYSTYGEGPPIVVGPRWVSHLEEEWADADQRPFYAELARTHRVVRFDRIGCGLSSRELDPRPTVESESRQLEAVIDAVGGSAIVFASSCCCLAASQLAVRRPGATDKIVYFGGYATRNDIPEATKASLIAFIGSNWRLGAQMLAGLFDPHASGDAIAHYTQMQRAAASAEAASDLPRARPERRPARPAPARRGACTGAASPR